MEEELRAAPPSYRNAMSTKLRLYRRDLGKLQRDMKTSAPGLGSTKQPLEGGHHGIYSSQNQQSVSLEFGDVNPVWVLLCLWAILTEPRLLPCLHGCLQYEHPLYMEMQWKVKSSVDQFIFIYIA